MNKSLKGQDSIENRSRYLGRFSVEKILGRYWVLITAEIAVFWWISLPRFSHDFTRILAAPRDMCREILAFCADFSSNPLRKIFVLSFQLALQIISFNGHSTQNQLVICLLNPKSTETFAPIFDWGKGNYIEYILESLYNLLI